MKKFKLLGSLGLLFLAVLTFSLSIFLAQPSDAISARNEMMIELGLIDEVKTAEELGLEHLLQQPPQLHAGLIDNIRTAESIVAQFPENDPLAIPLGTNSPVSLGELTHDNGDSRLGSSLEAIGSVNGAGQIEPITPKDEEIMFRTEAANGGTLAEVLDGSRQMLVADASGSFLQAARVPVFDIVVHNRRNNRVYLVPNVVADAFCRDALNDVLQDRRQRRNTINLRRLGRI